MPFSSMCFLKRKAFLIENGNHRKNTLIAVESGAFFLGETVLSAGAVVWFPKTFTFTRRVLDPLTILFAETEQDLPLPCGVQQAEGARVLADLALLHGKSAHDPYAAHLLNDLVWCCKAPKTAEDSVVRVATERFVRSGYRADFAEICRACGVSQAWLIHHFKQYTGRSPGRFFAEMKLEKAKELLTDSALSVTEIAEVCGYESAAYFSNCFRAAAGISPRAFRQAHVI